MKKFLLAFVMLLGIAGATPVHAENVIVNKNTALDCSNIDIRGKSSSEIYTIQQACDSITNVVEKKTITPTEVKEWASLAKDFGTAIGASAKEVGMAVNEFMVTPAGILLTLYLFWSKIGGVILGIPLLIALWFLYFKVISYYRNQPVEYGTKPMFWGLWTKTYVTKYNTNREHGEVLSAMCLLGLVCIGFSALIIGTLII